VRHNALYKIAIALLHYDCCGVWGQWGKDCVIALIGTRQKNSKTFASIGFLFVKQRQSFKIPKRYTNWDTDYALKVEGYALCGIPEYWIVNYLPHRPANPQRSRSSSQKIAASHKKRGKFPLNV